MKTRSQIKPLCQCALTGIIVLLFSRQLFAQEKIAKDPVASTSTAQDDPAADDNPGGEVIDEYPLAELPPLKRLVLYNSGVGQLQHEGEAVNKQRFEIKFSAHDVDDVLKSLVFSDMGGGTVRAVEYQPAPEPEDVAANTVGMPMTLAQLIQRFRGESVTFSVGNFQYAGTIYGVENRTEGEQVRETVVLITDDGLKSVDLSSVDRVQFDKEELRKTLGQAMQGIVKSRKASEKTLELLLDGTGKRNVRFAYVVDMPIWRMTYRLSIKQDKVYLQGWAHVDNVTGVDWEQVVLELRSGKPQSFHVNIFSPLMAERPDFGNAVYEFTEGLILVTQWFGFESGTRFGKDQGSGPRGGGGFGGGGGVFGGGVPSRGESPGVDIETAFRQTAQESRTAQMVRYVLDKPVDLGAGRSAALPVFANEVPARLISVFSERDQGTTPFRAVQITNATGLPIVSGPVSIMREGDFVGDGKLGRLDVEQKTEVVYGVDRAVEVKIDESGQLDPKLVSVTLDARDGIVLQRDLVRKTVFRIHNRDTESRDLVLYCAAANSEAAEKMVPEPESVNESQARFAISIDARTRQNFEIQYQSTQKEIKALNGANARVLGLDGKPDVKIDAAAKQLLEQLIGFEDDRTATRDRAEELKTEKKILEMEQNRVRDNVRVLSNNQEAAKPFLEKLQSIENSIEGMNEQIIANRQEMMQLRQQQSRAIKDYFGQ